MTELDDPNAEELFPEQIIDPQSGTLLCPVCDYDYSHIQRVYTRPGCDKHEAGIYDGTEPFGGSHHRRSALVVEVKGECGHVWNFVIQQHKGQNFVWNEIVNEGLVRQ